MRKATAAPLPVRDDELAPLGFAVAGLARAVAFALERTGLSMAQFRILSILQVKPVIATGLADRLGITSASVTAMIDRLVDAGWVTRLQDPADRRRVIHQLTQAGQVTLREAEAAVERLLSTVAATLPDDDRDALLASLPRWGAALARRVAEADGGADGATG